MKNPNCLFFHHRSKIYIYKHNAAYIPKHKIFSSVFDTIFYATISERSGHLDHGNAIIRTEMMTLILNISRVSGLFDACKFDKICHGNIFRYEKIFPVIFLGFFFMILFLLEEENLTGNIYTQRGKNNENIR